MDALTLQLLVLAVSGLTAGLVGLVFRRLDAIGKDVAAIREKVGEHGERIAKAEARLDGLEKHGCSNRRECLRVVKGDT